MTGNNEVQPMLYDRELEYLQRSARWSILYLRRESKLTVLTGGAVRSMKRGYPRGFASGIACARRLPEYAIQSSGAATRRQVFIRRS